MPVLRKCVHLATWGLGLVLGFGVARAELVLKIETIDVPWGETGTYHYVEELRLSAGPSAPLVLRTSFEHDVFAPIPGPQYPLGDRHVLLLGWSSTGAGAETLHALVLEVGPTGVHLRRHVTMTRSRGDSVLIVRRVAPAEILLGFLDPGPPEGNGNDQDYSLVLGTSRKERLSWPQVGKLVYVTTEPRPTDYFYAPPFGSTIEARDPFHRVLVRDGAVGSETLVKLVHAHVAWLTVDPEHVTVSAPPH
jgi:hypothetical protein